MGSKITWQASAEAYWQSSDYILVEVGGAEYEHQLAPADVPN